MHKNGWIVDGISCAEHQTQLVIPIQIFISSYPSNVYCHIPIHAYVYSILNYIHAKSVGIVILLVFIVYVNEYIVL